MIVIKLTGGLGNQMFQYATAKALSLKLKQQLYLDDSVFKDYKLRTYSLNHFKLKQNFYRPNKYLKFLSNHLNKPLYYKEQTFEYNPDFELIKGNKIFLEGYFQSEEYFKEYEKEIRQEFEIIAPLKEKTKEVIKQMKSINSVSIHIRRGDYIGNSTHGICDDKYYQSAIKIMEEKIKNPVFFVFSDDMDWVKENFKSNHETYYIDFNDENTAYEDLKLMTSCKHNIIANSSFSWWGAWLNPNPDKIIIAPKKWFNDTSFNTQNLLPDNWIKID